MTVTQMVCELRALVADECIAQNKYATLLATAKTEPTKHCRAVVERLSEILKDEIHHTGSLLYLISELDETIADGMREGAKGA